MDETVPVGEHLVVQQRPRALRARVEERRADAVEPVLEDADLEAEATARHARAGSRPRGRSQGSGARWRRSRWRVASSIIVPSSVAPQTSAAQGAVVGSENGIEVGARPDVEGTLLALAVLVERVGVLGREERAGG